MRSHAARHHRQAGQPYQPRQAEQTALHRITSDHLATMLKQTEHFGDGHGLPAFVRKTFDELLQCGVFAYGFVRVRCGDCGDEKLVALSCKRRGICSSCEGRRMADSAAHLVDRVLPECPYRQWTLSYPKSIRFLLVKKPRLVAPVLAIFLKAIFRHQRRAARQLGLRAVHTGAVTFVQRFGSSVNLHLHWHATVPDGVFAEEHDGDDLLLRFHQLPRLTHDDLDRIAKRVIRQTLKRLEREDLADWDEPSAISVLQAEAAENPIAKVFQHATTKRRGLASMLDGFSLHASGVIAETNRKGLEQVLRYGARPAISQDRLSYDGKVVRYRVGKQGDAAYELTFDPPVFLRRLACLIPPPRQNVTRFHGVFAPRSRFRRVLTPLADANHAEEEVERQRIPPRARLKWAELLKRVFETDVTVCGKCKGKVTVLAAIRQPEVVRKIINQLGLATMPPARASPVAEPESYEHGSGDHGLDYWESA